MKDFDSAPRVLRYIIEKSGKTLTHFRKAVCDKATKPHLSPNTFKKYCEGGYRQSDGTLKLRQDILETLLHHFGKHDDSLTQQMLIEDSPPEDSRSVKDIEMNWDTGLLDYIASTKATVIEETRGQFEKMQGGYRVFRRDAVRPNDYFQVELLLIHSEDDERVSFNYVNKEGAVHFGTGSFNRDTFFGLSFRKTTSQTTARCLIVNTHAILKGSTQSIYGGIVVRKAKTRGQTVASEVLLKPVSDEIYTTVIDKIDHDRRDYQSVPEDVCKKVGIGQTISQDHPMHLKLNGFLSPLIAVKDGVESQDLPLDYFDGL